MHTGSPNAEAPVAAATASRPTGPPVWFRRWQRPLEYAFWIMLTLVNGAANSITVLMDVRRVGLDFAAWEPAVWEWSSGLVMLALVPALVVFTRRFPLLWDTWQRFLPWHLLASVVFSVAHVLLMVGIRKLVYASQDMHYDFGPWPKELLYEYLKDVRSYVNMVAIIEVYRFLCRQVQGEASLLGQPEEGEPVEPVERPERFVVRKLGRDFLIATADIEWMQAAGNYVNLRVRGHDYPLRTTLGGLEARLDPGKFVRVHRSYMVNVDEITAIEPVDSGDARLHLRDQSKLPCSRRYRETLRARFG